MSFGDESSQHTRKRRADGEPFDKRDAPPFIPRLPPNPWADSTYIDYYNLSVEAMPENDDGPFPFDEFLNDSETSMATESFPLDDDYVISYVTGNTEIQPNNPTSPEFQETVPLAEPAAVPTSEPERRSSRTGPTEEEWEKHRKFLSLVYGQQGLTLPEVMEDMEALGALKGASEKMYKTRFRKWEIVKKERTKARRPAKPNELTTPIDNCHFPGIFEAVDLICESNCMGTHGIKWAYDNQYGTFEDEWDGPFGEVMHFILQVGKSAKRAETSPDLPKLESIRGQLKVVVEALGFFSLPTILTFIFRMDTETKDTPVSSQAVAEIILECQNLSESVKTPRHEPLTRLLKHVHFSHEEAPEGLQHLIKYTIERYITRVYMYSEVESTTFLSLLSFYLVYVNSDDKPLLRKTLIKIERHLKQSEKENGRLSDTTLEILRLAVFILQKMDDKDALWAYSHDIKERIDERRESSDGRMDGKLLDDYLDVTHLLANLNKEMGSDIGDRRAMKFMKEYKSAELCKTSNDGYDKILEDQMEELKAKMEASSIL